MVSVPPSSFSDFYATLAYGPGQEYALIRDDGALLARYPAAPPGAPDQAGEGPGFRRTIATDHGGGFYTSTSPIDGVTRRFAARRLGDTPLYLSAGIATPPFARNGSLRWRLISCSAFPRPCCSS